MVRTSVGTNHHGQTFFDFLLHTLKLSQLEFDTMFALWLEQSCEHEQTVLFNALRLANEAIAPQVSNCPSFAKESNLAVECKAA